MGVSLEGFVANPDGAHEWGWPAGASIVAVEHHPA